MVVFRYKDALATSRWNGIRQGALIGAFTGWLVFAVYLVYTAGFIFGSLLIPDESPHNLTISDIIVVSNQS